MPSTRPIPSTACRVSRRSFLRSSAAVAGLTLTGCRTAQTSPDSHPLVLDTHTHFYDPTRPQGIPWPPAGEPQLYRPVLPAEFEAMSRPLGVRGTIVVEASPWEEDNAWVVELASAHPSILGVMGYLKPGQPGFSAGLARFGRHSLFKGIRAGGWNVPLAPENKTYIRDLEQLAERGLVLDVIVGPEELHQIARLAQAIPKLPMVVNHVGNLRIDGQQPPQSWRDGMRACSNHSNVFCKVSGLVEGAGQITGRAPTELSVYRPVLEALWEMFGSHRLIYGSNWPVSARFADYATVQTIALSYFGEKGSEAVRHCFWTNARKFYRVTV